MNKSAESYVKLVLATGRHDRDYVDAYYGPEEWKREAEASRREPAEIRSEALRLLSQVRSLSTSGLEEMDMLRRRSLARHIEALAVKADLLAGRKLSFDEEAAGLYDAAPPRYSEDHFKLLLADLDSLLPGSGAPAPRYQEYKARFIIPREKLDAVFDAAITEARRRTRAHLPLPDGESFQLEYVTDKSWSGYNWYKGNGHSLIQINTDLPIYIDRAVDLACHEGYPGHHVYNLLLEENLVKKRNWVEYSVYPLFSPRSLIAEGSANYGIEVAFPGEERVRFEKSVLFPLAGLDPETAGNYYKVQELAAKLNYAGNEAARQYLDGTVDAEQAEHYLQTYALMSPDRARQRIRFIGQYRSYVINYNYGLDLVRQFIESRGGTADDPTRRWALFAEILSSPRLPSGLK